MCFGDLISELQRKGVTITESQIRWAIRTNKVTRPRIDGSLRFVFSDENVAELVSHFVGRKPVHA